MASKQPPPKGATGPSEPVAVKLPNPISSYVYDPVIRHDGVFPDPDLYFKVYDSEIDEPEAKIRRDVGKLYERWQAKYGRRWPENGMNTEDLVWLAEEAWKPGSLGDEKGQETAQSLIGGTASAAQMGLVPIEKEEYPGEFISEPGVDASLGGVTAGGAKKKKKKKQGEVPMSNYEATAAGGNWVTDEFESIDYEAGNLETLWDMHLWDREGKPILMPEGRANEAQGEESEDFDDFYGSYRPRHVDTDDAREAVWATDEYESDEDNTESEWEPEYVGAGLGLTVEDPINPQYSLRHSNHPLAPFPGEALRWSSFVYDDGTTFEGLTRDAVPHGMGVMIMGNGTGGGFHFRDVRRGDKYEGEFQVGYAHGLGQFVSENRGEVYIGEFFAGQRHGCGIRINMEPYNYLLARGEDPVVAYQKTHENIMRNIEFRTWYRNKALGSDHEDEVVLHAVRDDLDDPLAVVMRHAKHEAKLKNWASMDVAQKALTKAVEIIESVAADRASRRSGMSEGRLRQSYGRGEDGAIHVALDANGNDTEWDSVELMVGVDSDGGPGLGWQDDTQLTEEFPYDSKLAESIAADVAEDKMEESEDKEAILGKDILNPFTGLSVRDYLDGREGTYKELLKRTGIQRKMAAGQPLIDPLAKEGGGGRRGRGSWLAKAADGEGTTLIDGPDEGEELQRILDAQLTRGEQAKFADLFARRQAADAADKGLELPRYTNGRNPFKEDTDTRFETESEMMELCEIAEILGTVDEAKEVVTKARMWRWKPEGEVTLRYAQDAQGSPLPLMQDPLHYPHGTKFMAPGPLGQCHPIPDSQAIRQEMLRAASNYAHIYSLYNFDYDPEPGSVQYKIDERIRRATELRLRSLTRMGEAARDMIEEGQLQQQQEQGAQMLATVASADLDERTFLTGVRGEESSGKFGSQDMGSSGNASTSENPSRVWVPHTSPRAGGWGGLRGSFGGAPVASMVLSSPMGLSRASQVVLHALSSAAKAVPSRRPRLARPVYGKKQSRGVVGGESSNQERA